MNKKFLIMIKKKMKNETLRQIISFSIVGVSNTAVSYLLYILFLHIFDATKLSLKYDYLISSLLSFYLSVLWSFYWNNKITFKTKKNEKRNMGRALLRTYLSCSLTGVIVQNILLYIFTEVFEISKIIAPLFCIVFTVPMNFLLNKFWAFRQ